jgi:AcrR family transcriptional regulator
MVIDPRQERTRSQALATARQLLLTDGIGAVTHVRVADAGGGARRTLYRHWSTSDALLLDTLAGAGLAETSESANLEADLVAHLWAFQSALQDGPLAYVICAIVERATTHPDFEPLRTELTLNGCKPLRDRLQRAIAAQQIHAKVDIGAAQAMLEGPVLYGALLARQRLARPTLLAIVKSFLETPPLRVNRR